MLVQLADNRINDERTKGKAGEVKEGTREEHG